jgi:hypothetical protein
MLVPGSWAQGIPGRLPRSQFDVIPPAERVLGTRGDISVWQTACRVGTVSQSRRRIVDIAVQEWAAMGFQTVDASVVETRLLPAGLLPDVLDPVLGPPRIRLSYPKLGIQDSDPRDDATVAGYWSATPEGPRIVADQNRAWNAPGGDSVSWVEPWSAAFISWVMCEAGLGDPAQFQRSAEHITYIDQAIRARDGMAPDAAYVAYDVGEAPINPGDLLCNSRAGTQFRNLADARQVLGMDAATHCDVVVKMDARNRRVLVIGGNVASGVSLTMLPLTGAGSHYLRPLVQSDIAGARRIFAHLKLRADPIEPNALDNSPTIRAQTVNLTS